MRYFYDNGYKSWGDWTEETEKEISLKELKNICDYESDLVFIKNIDLEKEIIIIGIFDPNY